MRSDKGPWKDADIMRVSLALFSLLLLISPCLLKSCVWILLTCVYGNADGSEW